MLKEIKSEIRNLDEQESIKEIVTGIIRDVISGGDHAIKQMEEKFDHVKLEHLKLSKKEIEDYINKVPDEIKKIIDYNATRIEAFARFQLGMYKDMEFSTDNGGTILGQKIIPLESVGAYVPGGNFPLLSTPLMTIIPARMAGVKRIIACTPPGENKPDPAVIYSIIKGGADEIYMVGGAQAIAAMAYGTESIDPVDKIVGPGNAFVNEAKRVVFGTVGIDLLAGPSEILIIADESANAESIIVDILSQAEHDKQARACLVTTSGKLAESVNTDIGMFIDKMSSKSILMESWKNHGIIKVVDTLNEAINYANQYAPEHLELHLNKNNQEIAFDLLKNYGSLFIGSDTPVVFSDKLIGTNHTLPTNTVARYSNGLSVGNFIKIVTYQKVINQKVRSMLAESASKQSDYEGLPGHAASARLRLEKPQHLLKDYKKDE